MRLNNMISYSKNSEKMIIHQYDQLYQKRENNNTSTLKIKLVHCLEPKMTSYDQTDIESKHIYWCFLRFILNHPSCIERWSKDNLVLPGNHRKELFSKQNI